MYNERNSHTSRHKITQDWMWSLFICCRILKVVEKRELIVCVSAYMTIYDNMRLCAHVCAPKSVHTQTLSHTSKGNTTKQEERVKVCQGRPFVTASTR